MKNSDVHVKDDFCLFVDDEPLIGKKESLKSNDKNLEPVLLNPTLTKKEQPLLDEESRLLELISKATKELKVLCFEGVQLPEGVRIVLTDTHKFCFSIEVFKEDSCIPYCGLTMSVQIEANESTSNVEEFYFNTSDFLRPEKGSNEYCDKTMKVIEDVKKNLMKYSKKIMQKMAEEGDLSENLYQISRETELIHEKFVG